ncbi:MAG TPA: response regulator transcription factor [Acidimicrobiales bacterium]|nr:response regulator transcription factor [Acidimicrobiales bacterium]
MTGIGVGVLVVDDQAPFRRAARAVLERSDGFELIGEAQTGEEAVALVGDLHPSLVLMDINMPGMGGVEAARRIVTADPDVVVILCSTRDVPDVPATVAASGARAYLSKESFGVDELRRIWTASTA